ncbi:hypothetical protein [Devosia sp.]|uniref:hypothetical protein n=1 Tax=Devosia sp. TaxID=1871048 RepID=UPI00292E3E6C|nr:hypothetical protein [Devosia sp.]
MITFEDLENEMHAAITTAIDEWPDWHEDGGRTVRDLFNENVLTHAADEVFSQGRTFSQDELVRMFSEMPEVPEASRDSLEVARSAILDNMRTFIEEVLDARVYEDWIERLQLPEGDERYDPSQTYQGLKP